jgi:nucleoside-diphosphate-sugar epimerase
VGIKEAEIESALYRTNTEGTRRLASAVADSGSIKRLLFVSSVKAISTRPNAADEAEGIDSIYGRSKYLAERAVQACLQGSISDWCILRPCLVYGPGNLGNMDRLLKLVNTGLPLPFGAIHNRRSFLFVSNLTDAIVCCLTNPRAARRTFSVADGAPLSTPDLVRKMAQYTHRSVCLLPVPVSFMKAVAYLGDLAKFFGVNPGWDTYSVDRLCGSLWVEHSEMQSALAWAPRYSTAEGLKLTIESAS